jgi:hypothetical protein
MEPRHAEVLHLLLSHADGHRPFLEQGLPAEAARQAPESESLPGRTEVPRLARRDAHPNDLPAQRWGVIAPEGAEGDAMLGALEPLLRYREGEQRAPVRRYRVPAGMDAEAAVAWRDTTYLSEKVPQAERPKYLLLLGDLHQLSIELQHVLAHGAYVGRLHVAKPSGAPDLEGYAAYAEKVRAFETGAATRPQPDVVLYAGADGSSATEYGRQLLVEPCGRLVEEQWKPTRPGLGLQVLTKQGAGLQALLDAAAQARSGVMLSMSHGVGLASGTVPVERQWALQGALDLGPGQLLTRDLLRATPFLPGGMWFCLACFGAATPRDSMFHPWLALLAQQGQEVALEAVLRCLPGPGQRPFLAALPQAALANPRGPLAIIGHSDLAWMFSFTDADEALQSRASRIASVLEVLANGSRAGVALDALMDFSRAAAEDLMADYHVRRQAELNGTKDPIEPKGHAYRWMLRNDLRGYILLGDPAARLSLLNAVA